MKSLERYVFGAFLSSFFLAFVVLSFVLTVSLMVQIVGYVLEGIPAGLVGRFALVSFPETMQWTIPLALLVSSILVFSRLSADRNSCWPQSAAVQTPFILVQRGSMPGAAQKTSMNIRCQTPYPIVMHAAYTCM